VEEPTGAACLGASRSFTGTATQADAPDMVQALGSRFIKEAARVVHCAGRSEDLRRSV